MASLEPTSIDFEQARLRGGARVEAFTVGQGFGPDLTYLVGLVAAGELDPQVGWRGPLGQGRRGGLCPAGPAGAGQGHAGGLDVIGRPEPLEEAS
ncbi:MAG TPA: hypothetical protein VIY28_08550 [Pseudonocardiaceae bacterium]